MDKFYTCVLRESGKITIDVLKAAAKAGIVLIIVCSIIVIAIWAFTALQQAYSDDIMSLLKGAYARLDAVLGPDGSLAAYKGYRTYVLGFAVLQCVIVIGGLCILETAIENCVQRAIAKGVDGQTEDRLKTIDENFSAAAIPAFLFSFMTGFCLGIAALSYGEYNGTLMIILTATIYPLIVLLIIGAGIKLLSAAKQERINKIRRNP